MLNIWAKNIQYGGNFLLNLNWLNLFHLGNTNTENADPNTAYAKSGLINNQNLNLVWNCLINEMWNSYETKDCSRMEL